MLTLNPEPRLVKEKKFIIYFNILGNMKKQVNNFKKDLRPIRSLCISVPKSINWLTLSIDLFSLDKKIALMYHHAFFILKLVTYISLNNRGYDPNLVCVVFLKQQILFPP